MCNKKKIFLTSSPSVHHSSHYTHIKMALKLPLSMDKGSSYPIKQSTSFQAIFHATVHTALLLRALVASYRKSGGTVPSTLLLGNRGTSIERFTRMHRKCALVRQNRRPSIRRGHSRESPIQVQHRGTRSARLQACFASFPQEPGRCREIQLFQSRSLRSECKAQLTRK